MHSLTVYVSMCVKPTKGNKNKSEVLTLLKLMSNREQLVQTWPTQKKNAA